MVEIAPAALLNHFFSISRLLAGHLDFQSAIRSVAEQIASILPHDHLDVCIVGLDGKFHSAYESGIETDWGILALAPVANSPIRSLLRGEVDYILTVDACTDPRFQFDRAWFQPIFDHKLRSRIHVPMKVHGEIFGAFSCSLQMAASYTMDDVQNARFIADLLSPYFFALRAAEFARQSAVVETEARAREEGLRQGALKLTEALESERQRIGMDLHDQTLADLTRLARRLEGLGSSEPVDSSSLDPITRGLQQCMQDLRQIIEQAKPSVLHLFGLAQAIENHLDRSIRDTGQSLTWTLHDDAETALDDLDPTVSIALFRVAQEAINNAVIHAGASKIAVRLQSNDGQITISVTDDGKGFSKSKPRFGSGIDNMKTRARLIGARCSIASGSTKGGTEVSVVVPVRDTQLQASARQALFSETVCKKALSQ